MCLRINRCSLAASSYKRRIYKKLASKTKSLVHLPSSLARPFYGGSYVPRPRAATSVATRIPADDLRNSGTNNSTVS